jgi:hypothetical protein
VESEENQTTVSLSSHSPWKSLNRDFHIPTAPTAVPSFQNRTTKPRKDPSLYPPHGHRSGSSFNENMLVAGDPNRMGIEVFPTEIAKLL